MYIQTVYNNEHYGESIHILAVTFLQQQIDRSPAVHTRVSCWQMGCNAEQLRVFEMEFIAIAAIHPYCVIWWRSSDSGESYTRATSIETCSDEIFHGTVIKTDNRQMEQTGELMRTYIEYEYIRYISQFRHCLQFPNYGFRRTRIRTPKSKSSNMDNR